jgi:hypothetical protein
MRPGPPEVSVLRQRDHCHGFVLRRCNFQYPREHFRLVDPEGKVDTGAVGRNSERRHCDDHIGVAVEDRAAGVTEAGAAATAAGVIGRLEVEPRGERVPKVHEGASSLPACMTTTTALGGVRSSLRSSSQSRHVRPSSVEVRNVDRRWRLGFTDDQDPTARRD